MAHYSPTDETAERIDRNHIYLVDSGGQYFDGTTDTTRTVHFGTPSDFEMETFTRVLKGFISMGMSTFPSNAPVRFIASGLAFFVGRFSFYIMCGEGRK